MAGGCGFFVALLAAIELQVRAVEEPYLLRTHSTAYADYAMRASCPFVASASAVERRNLDEP